MQAPNQMDDETCVPFDSASTDVGKSCDSHTFAEPRLIETFRSEPNLSIKRSWRWV